ncbi:MAG: biopolymer transporter ExbD [Calditrichaeota bacterium]|nr:biopolymer transporter ExbD [Calditrichota bacterium]MCB9088395.1 biopolymer transporter ExbD [Calditrichia bacterium]MCB0288727.1 biopolymer transporter ExbD [Calditrichota bacterium]MCB0297395.1 biopolymer transporter ExbD [Calditrichota bacterium]MCB0302599.1 biopolymer transporter ExbD [Calditrichota bacterium]
MAIKITRKSDLKIGVPTASMPDIIFQLLIFFMVTTVLREYSGLQVSLPGAKKIEKLESKRNVSTIWIDRQNRIVCDDVTIKDIKELRTVAYNKLVEQPRLVMSLRVDKDADMGIVIDVHQELRRANTLKVNYSALQVL